MASATFEVETIDSDAEVILVQTCFFAHIKLGSDIQEVTTKVASDAHWQHHSYIILLITGPHHFLELSVIEIGRIILV